MPASGTRLYDCVNVLPHSKSVRALAIGAGKVFTACDDSTIRVWDETTYQEVAQSRAHSARVLALVFDEKTLFSGGRDAAVVVHDVDGPRQDTVMNASARLVGHHEDVKCLAVSRGRLFSVGSDKSLRIWDCESRASLSVNEDEIWSKVWCIAVGGARLYAGLEDGSIHVWVTSTLESLAIMTGHTDAVAALLVHKGRIFSGSDDATIRVWDNGTYEHLWTMRAHTSGVRALALKGSRLYSGGVDCTLRVWDALSFAPLGSARGHRCVVSALVAGEDHLYSASWDGTVRVWDLQPSWSPRRHDHFPDTARQAVLTTLFLARAYVDPLTGLPRYKDALLHCLPTEVLFQLFFYLAASYCFAT